MEKDCLQIAGVIFSNVKPYILKRLSSWNLKMTVNRRTYCYPGKRIIDWNPIEVYNIWNMPHSKLQQDIPDLNNALEFSLWHEIFHARLSEVLIRHGISIEQQLAYYQKQAQPLIDLFNRRVISQNDLIFRIQHEVRYEIISDRLAARKVGIKIR